MKQRELIVLMTATVIFLPGCSGGISQSEYNQVVSERDELQAQYDNLLEDYEELESAFQEQTQEQIQEQEPTKSANMDTDNDSKTGCCRIAC